MAQENLIATRMTSWRYRNNRYACVREGGRGVVVLMSGVRVEGVEGVARDLTEGEGAGGGRGEREGV